MGYKVGDQGIAMVGFTQLQNALTRIEGKGDFGLEYELQRRLRVVGEKVAEVAPGFVTHKYGHTGELESSVRISVTKGAASVYSTSVYGGAQNSGASPKAGRQHRGPHIDRANASHWMNRAVASQNAAVADELDGLLDWLVDEFDRG